MEAPRFTDISRLSGARMDGKPKHCKISLDALVSDNHYACVIRTQEWKNPNGSISDVSLPGFYDNYANLPVAESLVRGAPST